jgi:GGDEF domain-containing protein
MMGTQLSLQFDKPPPFISVREPEPIRQPKSAPIASGKWQFNLGISFGLAVYTGSEGEEELLNRADMAMYGQKRRRAWRLAGRETGQPARTEARACGSSVTLP